MFVTFVKLNKILFFNLSFLTCKVGITMSFMHDHWKKDTIGHRMLCSVKIIIRVNLHSPQSLLNFSKWSNKLRIPYSYFSYFKPLLRFLSYCGNWCQQLWFRIANPKEGEVSELNNREKNVWQIHRMVTSTGKMVISKIIKLIRRLSQNLNLLCIKKYNQ